MIARIARSLRPRLEVIVQVNKVTMRNLDSGKMASVDAPFSCGHLVAGDVDILEHALLRALKQTGSYRWLSFPRATVSVPGRKIHGSERRMILDSVKNAGASDVRFDPFPQMCDEASADRAAYVRKFGQK